MQRVLVLGRGGAGKSMLAQRLGFLTGTRVIELDQHFWQERSVAIPPPQWVDTQRELIQSEAWIIDGDLGPYDVLEPRLEVADTVVILDFSLARCAWRSIKRAREGMDYWRWVISYRRRSLPTLMAAIHAHAPQARLYVLRTPRAVERFVASIPTRHARPP